MTRVVCAWRCIENASTLWERLWSPSSWTPHSQGEWNVETVIGHFVDAAWTYRFGPPAQDTIVVTLKQDDEEERGCEHPLPGIPLPRRTAPGAGVARTPRPLRPGTAAARREHAVGALQQRLVYGVEIHAPGFLPSDDGFSIEPGGKRVVTLRPRDTDDTGATSYDGGILTAPNLAGRIPIESA